MSKAVNWAREQRTGGPAEKAVLLILAAAVDGSGMCTMPTRLIADQANTDRRTACRILDRLRDRGLIEWTAGAGRAPSTYRLPVSALSRSWGSHPPLQHS
ncbi:MAG: hypothetical protein JO272_01125 [Pseudonocardiales bacterium]|nr:hypothetical protein [Pseudonocardiales bacterium]